MLKRKKVSAAAGSQQQLEIQESDGNVSPVASSSSHVAKRPKTGKSGEAMLVPLVAKLKMV